MFLKAGGDRPLLITVLDRIVQKDAYDLREEPRLDLRMDAALRFHRERLSRVLDHLAEAARAALHRLRKIRIDKRQVFGRMQRARMYLEGNSHRVVRIGELAELTNFSSWYLSKTFQSLYEESPQSLSARLRLERAALLLRETDMMIGEVASCSGFDNCCSFARAFRARYGTSASRYREGLLPVAAKSGGLIRKKA